MYLINLLEILLFLINIFVNFIKLFGYIFNKGSTKDLYFPKVDTVYKKVFLEYFYISTSIENYFYV